MKTRPKKPVRDFEELTKQRVERTKYELGKSSRRVSLAEDLLVIVDSPLKKTVVLLLGELAALVTMADGNTSTQTDRIIRGTGERPIPSFQPGWAGKRLGQVDRLLWNEAEALTSWVSHPSDPDGRGDVCGSCGFPASSGDRFCRQCGVKRDGTTRAPVLMVRCRNPVCDRHDRRTPRDISLGRSRIQFSFCAHCGGKLTAAA